MRRERAARYTGPDQERVRAEMEVEQEYAERRVARRSEQNQSLSSGKCGTGRKVVIHYRTKQCRDCGGTGLYSSNAVYLGVVKTYSWPCKRCRATGQVECVVDDPQAGDRKEITCLCCGKQLNEGEECR